MRTLEKQLRAVGLILVMSSITTWVSSPFAHAQTSSSPPPTLSYEGFTPTSFNVDSSQCNSDGSGTFTFSASGTAFGPYIGTYTETGTVTIDTSANTTNYSSNFTINSPQGNVTGTQTRIPNSSSRPVGSCVYGFFFVSNNYQAIITTPSGNYLDQGQVLYSGRFLTDQGEGLTSSQTQTTLIEPTSKDQCKDDGWKNYPQFKNQGECVSFVNHG